MNLRATGLYFVVLDIVLAIFILVASIIPSYVCGKMKKSEKTVCEDLAVLEGNITLFPLVVAVAAVVVHTLSIIRSNKGLTKLQLAISISRTKILVTFVIFWVFVPRCDQRFASGMAVQVRGKG